MSVNSYNCDICGAAFPARDLSAHIGRGKGVEFKGCKVGVYTDISIMGFPVGHHDDICATCALELFEMHVKMYRETGVEYRYGDK